MRILVCGGRDYDNAERVFAELKGAAETRGPISAVIHGGATGADSAAAFWCGMVGCRQLTFKPEWRAKGRAAGPIRNQAMIDEGKPDLVIAFPGGRGTADMVKRAEAAGIEILRVSP